MDALVPVEHIERKIYLIRGRKVMLDRDLAGLYEVKSIALRQQVKRNQERFPPDFVFQLNQVEAKSLVSQNVIPDIRNFGGFLPYVFLEQGIAMLSSVLKSRKAILVNVQIMRTFIRLRSEQGAPTFVLNQLNKHEVKLLQHEHSFKEVFQVLDEMRQGPETGKRKKIGFT